MYTNREEGTVMQVRFSLVMAAMVTAGVNVSGCAAVQQPTNMQGGHESQNQMAGSYTAESAEKIHQKIKRPSTVLELLTNLKVALDQNLLLREDFYTQENLKKISGGDKVFWIGKTPTRQQAGITEFGGMLRPVRVGNNTFEGVSYSVGRDVLDSEKIQANAHLSFMASNPDVTFEQIEDVFGKGWQRFPFFPPPTGRKFEPPTHPPGNDRIRYDFDSGHVGRSIVMEFHEDGTLYNITFSEETK